MLSQLPPYLTIVFILITIATILWFYSATRSKIFLFVILGWTVLQSLLGITGVYQNTAMMPPPLLVFGFLPAILAIIFTLSTPGGKIFINTINLKTITYAHTIRIPVELILAALYYQGVMSVFITYKGTNFDLFSGMTAPIVAYVAFRKSVINKKLLLGWNIVCLILLLNVVITATLCIPSPIQQLAFDQPNIAVLHFPFNLLPTVVVPLVLFGHLVALRKLNNLN